MQSSVPIHYPTFSAIPKLKQGAVPSCFSWTSEISDATKKRKQRAMKRQLLDHNNKLPMSHENEIDNFGLGVHRSTRRARQDMWEFSVFYVSAEMTVPVRQLLKINKEVKS